MLKFSHIPKQKRIDSTIEHNSFSSEWSRKSLPFPKHWQARWKGFDSSSWGWEIISFLSDENIFKSLLWSPHGLYYCWWFGRIWFGVGRLAYTKRMPKTRSQFTSRGEKWISSISHKVRFWKKRKITKILDHFNFRTWESYGCKVVISTADITTHQGCKKLLIESLTHVSKMNLKDILLENNVLNENTLS